MQMYSDFGAAEEKDENKRRKRGALSIDGAAVPAYNGLHRSMIRRKRGPDVKKKQKGFTLMELLVVVAIIAVLAAIAIPAVTAKLHRTRVVTDWANVRAFYGEIQSDFITTGKKNPNVPTDWATNRDYDWKAVTFLSGQRVAMKTGTCAVNFDPDQGYSIEYQCSEFHEDCHLSLPVK